MVVYYFPLLDNALDTIALPLATLAGIWVTQSSLPEMNGLSQWTIAIIAGGGTAGITKALNSLLRLGSTGVTGGLGNPIFSTLEFLLAIALSSLSLIVPILTGLMVMILLVLGGVKIGQWWTNRKPNPTEIKTE